MNPTTKLAYENLVNPTTEHERLMNIATKLVDSLVNLATKLVEENEGAIGTFYVKVCPTKNIAYVKLDEELFAHDEWLQVMQQKHHIDMMLFGEITSLEFENQMEDNMFATTHVCTKIEETETETQTNKARGKSRDGNTIEESSHCRAQGTEPMWFCRYF